MLAQVTLNLPEDVNTLAMIPVGYPEGKFGPPLREPAATVTHWDRWNDEESEKRQ